MTTVCIKYSSSAALWVIYGFDFFVMGNGGGVSKKSSN